jgi:hypothetical protein
MLLSCHQDARQNHDIKTANRSVECVAQLKYLRTTGTNQNLVQKEIKRRLISGNVCYRLVQIHLFFRLLSKAFKLEYTEL